MTATDRTFFALPLLGALTVALVAGSCIAGAARAEPNPDRLEFVTATPTEVPRARPASRSGREAVVDLAERHFPAGTAEYATRIAWCESSFNPNADTNPPYIGLWQIDPALHGWRTVAIYGRWRSLYEPEVNAAVAAHILADQGWGAWPVCSR